MSGHLGLDLDGVEDLSVVDSDDGTDHLGDDDHVSQVGLDGRGLLVDLALLLGLSELLDQTHRSSLESSLESSSRSGVDELRAKSSELQQVSLVRLCYFK